MASFDFNELVQAGKDAIAENRYSFDFDIVTSGDVDEVKKQVEKQWGNNASVLKASKTILISVKDIRGWTHKDEEFMGDMYLKGIIGIWQRMKSR